MFRCTQRWYSKKMPIHAVQLYRDGFVHFQRKANKSSSFEIGKEHVNHFLASLHVEPATAQVNVEQEEKIASFSDMCKLVTIFYLLLIIL